MSTRKWGQKDGSDYGYCSYHTRTPASGATLYRVRTSGAIGEARYDRNNVGVRLLIVVLTSGLTQ